MTISFCQHTQMQIIHLNVADPVQVQDFTRLFSAHQRYLEKSPFKVHLLLNMQRVKHVPIGLTQLCEAPALLHPNSGYIAIVGATSSLEALAKIIFRISHFTRGMFLPTEA